jgi:hypothetical protein
MPSSWRSNTSFQCAIQPGMRPMENITVNMLVGIPMALRMIPE